MEYDIYSSRQGFYNSSINAERSYKITTQKKKPIKVQTTMEYLAQGGKITMLEPLDGLEDAFGLGEISWGAR